MARIGGVNIPNHQHAEVALTAIYGVGRSRARAICAAARIVRTAKIKDLSDADMEKLREQVAKSPRVAGARSAYAHERAHAQGSAQSGGQNREGRYGLIDSQERKA